MIEIHNVICIRIDSDGRYIVTVTSFEGEGRTTDIYIRPECVVTVRKDDAHGYLHVAVE